LVREAAAKTVMWTPARGFAPAGAVVEDDEHADVADTAATTAANPAASRRVTAGPRRRWST
jgi:hypothetical protein